MSRPISRISDEEIIKKVQSGEVEPFGALVERYEAKMKRYAKKFLFNHKDAEDLVQEVFLKAYINIKSFDVSKKFSSWLYRIAHNEFINAIKKKGKEPLPFFDLDALLPRPFSKESPDRKLSEKELRQALNDYLRKLTPKYREPIILYYFEELNYQEIADILRIPIATVGVRLNRAKKKLKFLCQKLNYHS